MMMCFLISGSKLVNPFRFLEVFETWGPYIDGDFIKEQAVTAFQKGHWQKEKSVLLGKTQTTTRAKLPQPSLTRVRWVWYCNEFDRINVFFPLQVPPRKRAWSLCTVYSASRCQQWRAPCTSQPSLSNMLCGFCTDTCPCTGRPITEGCWLR